MDLTKHVKIPLQTSCTGHLTLKATINGRCADLILDTGAGATILDIEKSARFSIESVQSENYAIGAGDSNLPLMDAQLGELAIGDFRARNVNIHLTDLENLNGAFRQLSIEETDGVLGGDILSEAKAVIDYSNMTLYLKNNSEEDHISTYLDQCGETVE